MGDGISFSHGYDCIVENLREFYPRWRKCLTMMWVRSVASISNLRFPGTHGRAPVPVFVLSETVLYVNKLEATSTDTSESSHKVRTCERSRCGVCQCRRRGHHQRRHWRARSTPSTR
ncbi:hypothetical protein BIW11_11963 [Tropilaelaps mercedesae]|uniref:Uncharacterized protein n=1 Tax=Tropilaelaps mercedesae TaxID=418985 RepID=A0A1V9X978_9ACAR|nr:hypothetical protein BIW11_11963 [Tropilaelaps mercedesae]